MTATISRVPRPRAELTPAECRAIKAAESKRDVATDVYRAVVVAALVRGASFASVSTETGLSTNTLQRWKREAE